MIRHRSTWIAALAGGLVAVAAGALVLHFAGEGNAKPQSPPRLDASPAWPPGYGQMNLGIAYGTTPSQLLRELGRPTSRNARCWLYRGRPGTIRGRKTDPYVDAMKFCFSAGPTGSDVMMRIVSHMPVHTIARRDPITHVIHRTTYPASWGPPITIARVPQWYLQQSS